MFSPLILTDKMTSFGISDKRKRATEHLHLIIQVDPNMRMITDIAVGYGDWVTVDEIDLQDGLQ